VVLKAAVNQFGFAGREFARALDSVPEVTAKLAPTPNGQQYSADCKIRIISLASSPGLPIFYPA
jgi:hypothetical protein